MVSESAKYYQTHPAARARKAAYDTRFESSPSQMALSVGSWLVIMPNTTRSMVQLLAREWMLHIRSQVSDTSLLLSIVVLRQTWLGIEGQEVVADSDIIKGSHYRLPFYYLNKSLISQSIASATLVR